MFSAFENWGAAQSAKKAVQKIWDLHSSVFWFGKVKDISQIYWKLQPRWRGKRMKHLMWAP